MDGGDGSYRPLLVGGATELATELAMDDSVSDIPNMLFAFASCNNCSAILIATTDRFLAEMTILQIP